MNYYFFIILFSITSIKSKNISYLRTKKSTITNRTSDSLLYRSYNLTDLQEFKSTLHYCGSFDLTKTKFLVVDWDEIKRLENESLSVVYINILYPENTITNVTNSKKRISRWRLECSLNKCTFGLKFISNNTHYSDLIEYNSNISPDYSFMIMFVVKTNRLSLKTLSYGGHNYPLFYCPTKYWFISESNIIFKPHKSTENIKNSIAKQSKEILLPIYPQTINAEFFICGVIKQPMLSDIEVGYDIKYTSEKGIEIIKNDNKVYEICKIDKTDDVHFTFAFTDFEFNYDNKRRFIKKSKKVESIYFGEIFYLYSYYNKNGRLNGSLVNEPLKPKCIVRNNEMDKVSRIIPKIIEKSKLELFSKNNINHYFIDKSLYNRKFTIKCMSKFESYSGSLTNNYYSMAAKLELERISFGAQTLSNGKNILFLENILKNYGLYTCKVKLRSKSFLKVNVTLESVYFIPDHYSRFHLPKISINKAVSNIPACKMSFGGFSNLTHVEVKYLNLSQKIIDVNNSDIKELKKKYFKLKTNDSSETVNISCSYKTIVGSVFETHQLFEYKETSKQSMIVLEHPLIYDIKFYFIIFISIVMLFIILFFACIICRPFRKKVKSEGKYELESEKCKDKVKSEESTDDISQ
uniref:Ig-like domain-containing protein n=1 Tax=Strongyloides venezuelensis TaxID=75913 RepID=A0A0K0FMF4_STRVS